MCAELRTRRDVWMVTQDDDWPAALRAYETAVRAMRERDPGPALPTDRLGWRYLAAMHGIADGNGDPITSDPLWNNCQHGSWFFFPWHRMYLHAFETIVQTVLDDSSWSLPYWYCIDPANPAKGALPAAFRRPMDNNALYTPERSSPINSGWQMPDLTASLMTALNSQWFTSETGVATFGGGMRDRPEFQAEELGLLEGAPHGGVHVLVGNDYDERGITRRGWMGSPYTAALDPIFWLHHANIDRLWQMWLDQSPGHQNPVADGAWSGTEFSFPDVNGGLMTMRVGDVLDTTALGYVYESTTAPPGIAVPAVAAGPGFGMADVDVGEPSPPQLIGASDGEIPINTSDHPVQIPLEEPAAVPAFGLDSTEPSRVYLRIENVTGTIIPAPAYAVYVNLPADERADEHQELQAGVISTFGVAEASRTDALHEGTGITTVFEITHVKQVLEDRGSWDPAGLQISFVPVTVGPSEGIPESDLRAGRISVYSA